MIESSLSPAGNILLQSGSRVLVGLGVAEEWRVHTLDEAITALEDMRLAPGWKMGYVSYDFGAQWQGLKQKSKDEFETPFLYFVAPEEVRIYDYGYVPSEYLRGTGSFSAKVPKADMTGKSYASKIAAIHNYLREGETYEVNFAQRFLGEFEGDPLSVFQRLLVMNPSPHACYLNFEPVTVVSCSPERLVRGQFRGDGRMVVDTRPIKGTVPRGETPEEDLANIEELLGSEKDEAELNMIVDLARNDLGKVCEMGSVEVNEHRAVESYSHVHHTMSGVHGLLEEGKDWVDVLKAVFPGGSITGAPKKRTMKIIDELEPCARAIYTGSAGFISPEGEFDFNILIRSVAFQREQNRYSYHSGGAIVMDSVAKDEYQETLDKAAVLLEALG